MRIYLLKYFISSYKLDTRLLLGLSKTVYESLVTIVTLETMPSGLLVNHDLCITCK